MNRTTVFAVAAAILSLAACSGGPDAPASTANEASADNMAMDEDVSADGLAAPSDMPLDSESNSLGSASGGNAM